MWFEFFLIQFRDDRLLGLLPLRQAALSLLHRLLISPVAFMLLLTSVATPLIAAFRGARRALTVAPAAPRALMPVLVPLLLVLLRR